MPKSWVKPVPEKFSLTTRDGVSIHYYVVKGDDSKVDSKVMLFAPPLGQCGFGVYEPIMARYGSAYTYITWDYRGLHGSDDPKRTRRISIPMYNTRRFLDTYR